MTGLVEPLTELVQLGAERDVASCKTYRVCGQKWWHYLVWRERASGWGAGSLHGGERPETAGQRVIAAAHRPPASGWPMVPLTEKTPPVLVPPPPSIVCQSMEYCAEAGTQGSSANAKAGRKSKLLERSLNSGDFWFSDISNAPSAFVTP